MDATVASVSISGSFFAFHLNAVGLPLAGLFLALLIDLACYLLPLRAVLDVADHSKVAFYAAGYSKSGWIVSIAIGTYLFFPIGWLGAAYYYLVVRRKVVDYERSQLIAT